MDAFKTRECPSFFRFGKKKNAARLSNCNLETGKNGTPKMLRMSHKIRGRQKSETANCVFPKHNTARDYLKTPENKVSMYGTRSKDADEESISSSTKTYDET